MMTMNSENSPLVKIRAMLDEFTPVEKKIALHILKEPAGIPTLSIKELAHASDTSDASVLRFCKSLGYSGFKSFMLDLNLAIVEEEKDKNNYTDIRLGDSLSSIISNVFFSDKQALVDTENILDTHEVEKAIKMIKNGETLHFFGVGASGLVCLDAYQKFRRIGMNCFAHTDSHDQLTNAVLLGKDDVCIIFTYSGKTNDIRKVFHLLKENRCKIIIVSKFSRTNLLENADSYLHVFTPEVTLRSGAMGSRIAMLAIVDILLLGILSEDYEKHKEKLLKTYAILHQE